MVEIKTTNKQCPKCKSAKLLAFIQDGKLLAYQCEITACAVNGGAFKNIAQLVAITKAVK